VRPFKDLVEQIGAEDALERRIEELRPILEWGEANPGKGLPLNNYDDVITPRFVHALIRKLDDAALD